jgi:hypothetical protein
MPKQKKLYLYDANCQLVSPASSRYLIAVSEVKLPKPSKEHKGRCAAVSPSIDAKIPINTRMSIAIGDPIVLLRVTLIGRSSVGSGVDLPDAVDSSSQEKILLFRYKGKRVWVGNNYVCRLKDLDR